MLAEKIAERTWASELRHKPGQRVKLMGWVHSRRDLGGVRFLQLRDKTGVAQCVFSKKVELPMPESCVAVTGEVVANAKAPGGFELNAYESGELEIISEAVEAPPVEIPKLSWHVNPDTNLNYRYVSLREPKARAILKVQAEIVSAFRSFLNFEGFTEIFSPKIVSAGAEGGANLFEIDYYGKRAYLAQSPQLYKQIMVGVYERVYEVAPVYRAELSHTSRHLSEYLSLDVEMGFIQDEYDVMKLEERMLKSILRHLQESCQPEFSLLDAKFPDPNIDFPFISLLKPVNSLKIMAIKRVARIWILKRRDF
ncbi:MAG: amino acid--tRNA ligase-related protein [Deinococcales bacterium]